MFPKEKHMIAFCDNETCDNDATEVVPVSISETEVEYRRYCYTCSEAYTIGCQHGHFRAVRQVLRQAAKANKVADCFQTAGALALLAAQMMPGDDPGEEGLTPPNIDGPDCPICGECDFEDGICDSCLSEDDEDLRSQGLLDDDPPDPEEGIEQPPTREQTHEACADCELRRTDACSNICPHYQ